MTSAEEYEHAPVPPTARKSLPSVAAVWFGFPMNLGNAVFGGVIVYNLGLVHGLLAILVGNLVLFGYVGALSHYAGRTGKNFALQAADTFGRRGRLAAAGFLATVVIGWFSFQVGLTGTTLQDTLGWTPLWGALLGCAIYTLLTVAGIRALALVGAVATPCSSSSARSPSATARATPPPPTPSPIRAWAAPSGSAGPSPSSSPGSPTPAP